VVIPDGVPQEDDDAYYREKMGDLSEAWWVELYRSQHGRVDIPMPTGPTLEVWCSFINIEGTIGPLGKKAKGTLVISLDVAEQIAHSILRGVEAVKNQENRRGPTPR
jgi:hypothetical protein